MKFSSIGVTLITAGSIFGFVGGLSLIAKNLGFIWAVVAFFLAPATIVIAPIYQWAGMGDASLFMWSYGLCVMGAVLAFISKD